MKTTDDNIVKKHQNLINNAEQVFLAQNNFRDRSIYFVSFLPVPTIKPDKRKSPLFLRRGLRDMGLAATYSPTFDGSTIGATGLNFSVRNGKR
jgi:hypothetical protein